MSALFWWRKHLPGSSAPPKRTCVHSRSGMMLRLVRGCHSRSTSRRCTAAKQVLSLAQEARVTAGVKISLTFGKGTVLKRSINIYITTIISSIPCGRLLLQRQVCMLGLIREEPLDTYGLKFGINMKRCVHRPVIISRQPLVSLAFAANIIFQDPAHPHESAHRIHQAPETSGQDSS
jgi:hypothetical protein